MPMAAAQGHLGYARIGYTTLPSGTGWITVGSSEISYELQYPYSIAIDSADNILVAGSDQTRVPSTGEAQNSASLFKLNSAGINQYYNYIKNGLHPQTGSALTCTFNSCAVDSSDNVYAVGYAFNYVSSTNQSQVSFLAKYNNAGVLQWQRMFEITQSPNDKGMDIGVDGAGNSYVVSTVSTHSGSLYVTKYNTSGTLQWSRRLGVSSTITKFIIGIVVDSGGNQYIVVAEFNLNNEYDFHMIKLNNLGTVVWKIKFKNNFTNHQNSHTLTTNGTYICFASDYGYIIFDTSGNIVRQNKIDPNGGIIILGGAISADGEVYLLGSSGLATDAPYRDRYTIIIKFNSDDSFAYANRMQVLLQEESNKLVPYGIVYKNNSLYISSQIYSTVSFSSAVFKLDANGYIPQRGSYKVIIGSITYTFEYAAISISVVGSSITGSTSTYDVTSVTMTNYNASFSDGTRSWPWANLII